MTTRADDRLGEVPMTPVKCQPCGAEVLVRKSSWAQTSVQWDARSLSRCCERVKVLEHPEIDNGLGATRPGLFLACARLREAIESAACAGELPVLDEN